VSEAPTPDAQPEAQAPEPAPSPSGSSRARRTARPLVLFLIFLVVAGAVMAWRFRGRDVPPNAGKLVYSDDFDRADLGKDWRPTGEADAGWQPGTWTLADGRLRAEKIHNAGIWLQVPLPDKVRIEFDARAETPEGDVKCEVFGDGRTHQSGYIVIDGGWHNTVRTIARRDEHAEERKEDNRCDYVGNQLRCVEPDVDYHWTLIRTDGTLQWYLNGKLLLTYPDVHPVRGKYFGFNDWEAAVTFDNLRIYDLAQ
jgi:hypothetical protein